LEKYINIGFNKLRAVVNSGYSQMGMKGGHGITENQVCIPVKDTLLVSGKILEAQETGPFIDRSFIDRGHGAFRPEGIMPEAYRESVAAYFSVLRCFQGFISIGQFTPCLQLIGKEFRNELR
jgi:hypothetical protein